MLEKRIHSHFRQGNEMAMLPRYIEGRFFSLFKPSYASKQKINKRQKGGDRSQAFKHENSQKTIWPILC